MSAGKGIRWLALTATRGLAVRRGGRRAHGWRQQVAALLATASLLAGFIVVASTIAFGGGAASAVALGISVAVLLAAVGLTTLCWRARRYSLSWIGVGIASLAIWTIVATAGTFASETARWIAFGSGLGYSTYALAGLLLQLFSSERVVHVLEVRELGRPDQRSALR